MSEQEYVSLPSLLPLNAPPWRSRRTLPGRSMHRQRRLRRDPSDHCHHFCTLLCLVPHRVDHLGGFQPQLFDGYSIIHPPQRFRTQNFSDLLNDPLHPFFLWLWNSVKVAGITSVLAVFVTMLTAYSFSRFRFRGRHSLLLTILLIQVFPNLLTMVALFLFLRQIGDYFPSFGLNSHGGLILVYLGAQMGINIWLMKGYFIRSHVT